MVGQVPSKVFQAKLDWSSLLIGLRSVLVENGFDSSILPNGSIRFTTKFDPWVGSKTDLLGLTKLFRLVILDQPDPKAHLGRANPITRPTFNFKTLILQVQVG